MKPNKQRSYPKAGEVKVRADEEYIEFKAVDRTGERAYIVIELRSKMPA